MDFKHNNLTAAVLEVMAIVNAFSSSSFKDAGIVLEAIEIGNEPDLYANNGGRPSPYTVSQYISECVLVFRSRCLPFTHTLPLCQMEKFRCHDCINPTIYKILGCVFCSIFTFYHRIFATSYLRGGSYFSFARFFDLNVCLLSNSSLLCIHADRFVRGVEFHSTTIVEIFAQGKKDFCKI